MDILVIGDPHFTPENPVKFTRFIQETVRVLQETMPQFVVVLGDVLHTHEKLHTLALNMALKFIIEVSSICETFVLVGNHDMINNSQFLA